MPRLLATALYLTLILGTLLIGSWSPDRAIAASDGVPANVQTGRWPMPTGHTLKWDQATLDQLEAQIRQQLPANMNTRIRATWPSGPAHTITVVHSLSRYVDVPTASQRVAVVRLVLQIKPQGGETLRIHAGVISGIVGQDFVQVVCTSGATLSVFKPPCSQTVLDQFEIENPYMWLAPRGWP